MACLLCLFNTFRRIPSKVIVLSQVSTDFDSKCKHPLLLSTREDFDGKFVGDTEKVLLKMISSANKNPNPVLIDVGANIGLFTRLLCDSFSFAEIHSFEPGNEMAYWLKREVATSCASSKVTVHDNAVGDTHGVPVVLYGPAKQKKYTITNIKAHNTGASISEGVNKLRGSTTILGRTTTVRLDKLFDLIPRIELVKVDAEGFDPLVLRGLEWMLRRRTVQMIYWEFNKHWALASSHTYSQTVSWLADYNFTSYVIGKHQLIPISHYCLNPQMLDRISGTHNVLSILKLTTYEQIPELFNNLHMR
eukprot:CAMPEP_0198214592 /NCGR_PEP_ID=MMETSP1445-20131203/42531_1 /TAXON_ID=36898 /ORGANISM="Pyramimonas sp., Strain CCMP2087" /LENGTH=304 /DNA_ID=CAMNT_0043889855 /DNA_START=101 /DNA_END=1015 /DNA_ORIENTATION=+